MAGFRKMRSLGLALLGRAFTALPATAAVIEHPDLDTRSAFTWAG